MSGLSRDFTISLYKTLLKSFIEYGYRIIPFKTYLEESAVTRHLSPVTKLLVLRHDIDRAPNKALEIARMEQDLNIRSTYYFKIEPSVFNPGIIREIAEMGHEIGYHYEDLVKASGDTHLAMKLFRDHLERFRELVPVTTICAEGSPLSRFDNRGLWKENDYRDFGVTGEPYLDIDYSRFLYLTDTGRIWNGTYSNIRDKVVPAFDYHDLHTARILQDLENHVLPDLVHLVTHPQRWQDDVGPWLREWSWQRIKNVAKRIIISRLK